MSHHVAPGLAPEDTQSTRAYDVAALLALASRSESTRWSRDDVRSWVEMTRGVQLEEIESSLTLAALWGADGDALVPAAAHILLVRLAPRAQSEQAARARRNIDSVCAHLRANLDRVVADRLPRTGVAQPQLQPVPDSTVWAYFFACLALVVLVALITR